MLQPTLVAIPLKDGTFIHSVYYDTIVLMVRYNYSGEVIEVRYARKYEEETRFM